MLRKKNLQLAELQLYINIIERCLGIVDILSTSRQDHQWNNLTKCSNNFTSLWSKNHKHFKEELNLHLHYTTPSTLFLNMSPCTNTQSRSSENISPYPDVTTGSSYNLETILRMLQQSQEQSDRYDNKFDSFNNKFGKFDKQNK